MFRNTPAPTTPCCISKAARSLRLAEWHTSASTLILAPTGRDAEAIARVLADMELHSAVCPGLDELCAQLSADTPLLIVTEEGLSGNLDALTQWLAAQPTWSDLPLLLLAVGGVRRGSLARWGLFERLGNVTILDRPLHVGGLQGAVRAALRARRRQYQARSYLEQLEAARLQLEQKVAERTHQLETEMEERQQVEAALSRAQRLEAVGQLTGGVAHDFNNLLQVIMGGITVIDRLGDDPERRRAMLTAMRQASQRGAKLTQQLLAFARRQPLAPELLDVAQHIEEMEGLLRGSLPATTELRLRLARDLWLVKADVTQLEVAVLNLVINARDAMTGGGEIMVSVENVTLAANRPVDTLVGDFVRITVRDTGAGMDNDTLQRAVEPFFSTKPVGRGTGLGLSQVHGFAQQSGGGVHLQSAPGRGTSVCIFLPRSSELLAPDRKDPGIGRQNPTHPGGKLLVVEDEDQVAALACEMLQELGYRVERVANAEEALGHANLSSFHAVFSDVVMPGRLDGVALAQELRRLHPALPILLATGYAGMPERIAEAGFSVLSKPYNFEQLSRSVATLLAKHHES